MNPSQSAQQMNLDLVAQVGALIGTGFADPDEDLFAPEFVFHFVNPNLPELNGDHHGLEGMRSLFERLRHASDAGFHNKPHSLTPNSTLTGHRSIGWSFVDRKRASDEYSSDASRRRR